MIAIGVCLPGSEAASYRAVGGWDMDPCQPEASQALDPTAPAPPPVKCHYLRGGGDPYAQEKKAEDQHYGCAIVKDGDDNDSCEMISGDYHASDSIDLEWDPNFVDQMQQKEPEFYSSIQNGEVRFGVGDLKDSLPTNEQLSLRNLGGLMFTAGNAEYKVAAALRSGGFPMCPNYWDTKWGNCDEPFEDEGRKPICDPEPEATGEDVQGPWMSPGGGQYGGDGEEDIEGGDPKVGPHNDKTGWKEFTQEVSYYKFPRKEIGSPMKGDPELRFCRRVQERTDATCCNFMLDQDIQEEYEELVGGGYLGAHVFLQQYCPRRPGAVKRP